MASTVNFTKSARVENGQTLSGAGTITAQTVDIIDQLISASADEEVTLSFDVEQLQLLALLSTQTVVATFAGERFAILDTANAAPTTITHTGDLEQEIFAGDLVIVENTVADDGVYWVNDVAEAGGTTTITLANGQTVPVAGGGAVGTVARVCSKNVTGYAYSITSTTLASGAIVITGDVSDKFEAEKFLIITGTVGNDGYWEIDSVTTDGPPVTITTIVVNQVPGGAVGLPATEGAVGEIYSANGGITLVVNEPYLWEAGQGDQNPLIGTPPSVAAGEDGAPPLYNGIRDAVVAMRIDNTGNTTAAQVDGRVAKNSIIF